MSIREAMEALLESSSKVWQIGASQYAAMRGHQPNYVASISPKQMAMGSKTQLNRYFNKRYAVSAKGEDLRREYEQAVLQAHLSGEFTWKRNPSVHKDAKNVIVAYIKATEGAALMKAQEDNYLSIEDVAKGDRVYVKGMHDSYGVISRVAKKAVYVLFDGATKPEKVAMYGPSPLRRREG